MPAPSPIRTRELPCPTCGYDLRAARNDRCPECGTITTLAQLTTSHIPWVHRTTRGRTKAYLQTLWMLFRHPRTLPREMISRQLPRDALLFHRISIILATLIGALIVLLALALRMPDSLLSTKPDAFWIVPAFVLWDSCWLTAPMAIGLYWGIPLAMAGLRSILCLGIDCEYKKRRARRLALYTSGFMPVGILLLGSAYLGGIVSTWDAWDRPGMIAWQMPIQHASIALVIIAILLLQMISLNWVIKIGQWKGMRMLILLFLFPPVAIAGIGCVLFGTCWLAGYLAITLHGSLM